MSGKPEQRSLDEVRKLLRSLEESSASDKLPHNVIVLPSADPLSASSDVSPGSKTLTASYLEPKAPSWAGSAREPEWQELGAPSTIAVETEFVAEQDSKGKKVVMIGACVALLTASAIAVFAWKNTGDSIAMLSDGAKRPQHAAALKAVRVEPQSQAAPVVVSDLRTQPAPAGLGAANQAENSSHADALPSADIPTAEAQSPPQQLPSASMDRDPATATQPASIAPREQELAQATPSQDTRLPPEFRPAIGANSVPSPPPAVVEEPKTSPPPPAAVEEPKVSLPPAAAVEEPKVSPPPAAAVEEPKVSPPPAAVVEEPKASPPPPAVVEQPKVSPPPPAVVEQPKVRLASSLTIVAGQTAPLQIAIEGQAPAGSTLVIDIRGRQGIKLSKGQELRAGTWSLPISDVGGLVALPSTQGSGLAEITVELRSPAAEILSTARGTIIVSAPPTLARPSMSDPVRPDEAETARLLTEGKRHMEAGQVAVARLLFGRAADAGNAEAARLLGDTFDPAKLYLLGVRGIIGDIGKAIYWYERADELGDPHAKARLLSLGGR